MAVLVDAPYSAFGGFASCTTQDGLAKDPREDLSWTATLHAVATGDAIMKAEQPGTIGLRHDVQLLWSFLQRWRDYRVGDYMRAVQQERNRAVFGAGISGKPE
jgi:hypothetical protein